MLMPRFSNEVTKNDKLFTDFEGVLNFPNDARNIKKGGWIDTGDPEGRNEYHTKWAIFRPDSP